VWAKPHDADWLGPRWAEVDDYLQAVIEHVVRAGSYVTEGMVQATIGRFPSTGFTVIDREAIVSFGSQPEKGRLQERAGCQMAGCPAPAGPSPLVEDQAGPPGRRMRRSRCVHRGRDPGDRSQTAHGLRQGHRLVGAAGWHVRQPLPAVGRPCRRQSPRSPARHGDAAQANRPVERGGNSACRAHQGSSGRRTRPKSKTQRKEKLAEVRAHLAAAGLATNLDVRQVNLVGRLDPLA